MENLPKKTENEDSPGSNGELECEDAIMNDKEIFIVVLKDDVKPDEFLKKHDVEKIKQYKHALNGLAVKGPSPTHKLRL